LGKQVSRKSLEPLTFAIKFPIFVSDIGGFQTLPTDGATETGLVPRLRGIKELHIRGEQYILVPFQVLWPEVY
jgi:hypothetical protein